MDVQRSMGTPVASPVVVSTPHQSQPWLSRFTRRFDSSPVSFEIQPLDGPSHRFGQGELDFRVVVKTPTGGSALRSMDEGKIAEAYVSGDLDIEGNILKLCDLRKSIKDRHPIQYFWRFFQAVVFGRITTNAKVIKSHYDLDADFYLSFLDPAIRCYTQGIFDRPDEPLDTAIHRKFDFCIESCGLKPGDHVLDIGPGWGGFAEYATRHGIRITGITNSQASVDYMNALGERLGLSWEIVFEDLFRYDPSERFDAIVIMGVMEHLPNYLEVLRRFERLLKPGGRVYLDASAARKKYRESSFISRHIYPGNHSFFVIHDFLKALAETRFHLQEVHDDRVSYYHTFTRWANNFERNRRAIIDSFGEYHFRRFHLYLWGSAHSFLTDVLQCYRVVLQKPHMA